MVRTSGRVSTHLDVQPGPVNRQTSFSGRGDACELNLPFSGHIINTFRRPTILQLNIEGLTVSKMNVLYHLAVQHEALVILLQETHCTSSEKLKLPSFALNGFFLSRKHGLATFGHEGLKYTLLKQSPLKSETEWLCVDVDGYIVNVYKPPPTRLQAPDLSVFPHFCLSAGYFNCPHADWDYGADSADGECLVGWASINSLSLLYNPKDSSSFHSGCWSSGTNPDLAFASADSDSRVPDRRVLEKFPKLTTIVNRTTKVCFASAKHAL